jgi:hypothetical protein
MVVVSIEFGDVNKRQDLHLEKERPCAGASWSPWFSREADVTQRLSTGPTLAWHACPHGTTATAKSWPDRNLQLVPVTTSLLDLEGKIGC